GERFDAAVIFTVYTQNPLPAALLCYLADIPRRLAHSRENPYQLLTHWIPEPEPQQFVRHEVQRQLDLVAQVGARTHEPRLRVRYQRQAANAARARLAESGVDADDPFVVVHAGASAPSRRYPPESFAAAARSLYLEHGCQLVFTGGANERALVDSIIEVANVPAASLAGRTSLEELAALLASAS